MEKIVYDAKHKVWMQEGATFRQIGIKDWRKEVQRVDEAFEKLSVRKGGYATNDYYFSDRKVFVSLLKNLMKGGYEHLYTEGSEMRMEKHWYSYRLRAKYRHVVIFSKSKGGGYKISTFNRINNPKGRKVCYGWKYAPVENVSRHRKS